MSVKRYLLPAGFVLSAACCLLTACHQLTIHGAGQPEAARTVAEHSANQGSVVAGLITVSDPARADCADGLERVTIRRGPLDTVVHIFVGGIYTSRTVEVRCRASATVDATADDDAGKTLEKTPAVEIKEPVPTPTPVSKPANRITLKNGQIIEGTILTQTRRSITIEVNGSRRVIQKSEIRRIEFNR
jgi:hypothetical protein